MTAAARTARWKRSHRPAQRAHRRVALAVARGELVRRPCPCGSRIVEAHHPRGYDGAHALDVEWLCRTCHRAAHRATLAKVA